MNIQGLDQTAHLHVETLGPWLSREYLIRILIRLVEEAVVTAEAEVEVVVVVEEVVVVVAAVIVDIVVVKVMVTV